MHSKATLSVLTLLLSIILVFWTTESNAVAVPEPAKSLADSAFHETPADITVREPAELSTNLLQKRRGGGGGGGRGGGGGKGGGGKGGSGGSRGSSSGSGPTSGTSNTGGRTSSGSGISPGYRSSRGLVYAGGSSVPYRAGAASPRGFLPAGLLLGGGLGFWVGSSWGRYGAYEYRFPANVTFYNSTAKMNETLPGTCLCARYQECSCEVEEGDQTYVVSLLGDGTYNTWSQKRSLVQVDNINGSRTIVVNGTLANGTTAAGIGGLGRKGMLENAAWGVIAVGVACMVHVL